MWLKSYSIHVLVLSHPRSSCPARHLRPFKNALHPSWFFTDAVAAPHDCPSISFCSLSALLLKGVCGLSGLLLPYGPQVSAVLVMLQPCPIHLNLRFLIFTDNGSVLVRLYSCRYYSKQQYSFIALFFSDIARVFRTELVIELMTEQQTLPYYNNNS